MADMPPLEGSSSDDEAYVPESNATAPPEAALRLLDAAARGTLEVPPLEAPLGAARALCAVPLVEPRDVRDWDRACVCYAGRTPGGARRWLAAELPEDISVSRAGATAACAAPRGYQRSKVALIRRPFLDARRGESEKVCLIQN